MTETDPYRGPKSQVVTSYERPKIHGSSKLAAWIVGYLSVSPLVVGLDMVIQFLPDAPAVQYMRSVEVAVRLMWASLGMLGLATAVLLLRRPVLGLILLLVFAPVHVYFAQRVWGQATLAPLLAIGACVVAAIGAWKSVRSGKPRMGQ